MQRLSAMLLMQLQTIMNTLGSLQVVLMCGSCDEVYLVSAGIIAVVLLVVVVLLRV